MGSRATGVLALTVAIAIGMACGGKPQDAKNPAAPPNPAASALPQYSYAQTNNLRVAPQLGEGWYGVEDGAWRWMAKESKAVLKNPGVFPAQFEVRLTFPQGTMAKLGGPIVFTVVLNGKTLGTESYSSDGAAHFEKSVEPGMLGPEPIQVVLRVSKAKAPVAGGDARELGAIVEGFGFK